MFVLHQSKQLRWKGSSLRCIGLLLNRCQYSSSAWLVWICFKLAGILFSFFVGLKTGQTRFQSSETKILSQSDDDLREELLRRLVDHTLLGPTRQIVELQPEASLKGNCPQATWHPFFYFIWVTCGILVSHLPENPPSMRLDENGRFA